MNDMRDVMFGMHDAMSEMREKMKRLNRLGRYGGYGGLKTMVLYTLAEKPKNGVEIMDTIEMMSCGHWKPSPGSIYPLLKKAMTEEHLVVKREDGRYELTPEGYNEIGYAGVPPQGKTSTPVDGVLSEIDSYLSYLEDLPPERAVAYRERLDEIAARIGRLRARFDHEHKQG
jgi:DNA-binding PadR family transcriptional regulator